ncbi:MAG: hypothetical protein GYA43_13940 [Bacteroidales bacterium]|nr:hypothetical protein [Bacteroidales bacterium]
MKEIIFKDRVSEIIRIIVGVFLAVSGISYFAANYGNMDLVKYLITAGLLLAALANITNYFGTVSQTIRETETGLEIKTSSMLIKRTISTLNIKSIEIRSDAVSVVPKAGRPVRIRLSLLDRVQKTMLTGFLRDFATRNNIAV